jgi:hypothetical protein
MRWAESVLGMGMDLPIPDDWNPVGAVVVVRCLDGAGRRRMTTRYAGDVMAWEAAGMLHAAIRDVDQDLDETRGQP